jgi:poly(3-hydroxybutyrate) depolymerase
MVSFRKTALAVLAATAVDLVTAGTAGCGKAPPSSGVKNIGSRQYTLQVPANYNPNTEYRLIFGFHWLNGNMNTVAPGYYGLRALAGETAIFVAPNGINAGWGNGGGSDVTFVDQILEQVQSQLCVDEKQRFAAGFSYGGAMSHAVACARPNIFRAIAAYGGADLSGCAGGTSPVAYLGIHGLYDNVLPVSRGRALRDKWLQTNQCASKNAPDPGNGQGHVKTEYSCRQGYPVWWVSHTGGHVGDAVENGSNYFARYTWDFFTKALGGGSSQPPPTQTTQLPPTQPQPTTGPCAAKWGQCGGNGWAGAKCCESGSTCRPQNEWYSQCV